MKKIILFPSESYNLKNVDPNFEQEYLEAKKLMDVALFDFDAFRYETILKIDKEWNDEYSVLLRSWMFTKTEYLNFYERLKKRKWVLLNTVEQYLNTHYYSNSYPLIKEYCSESVIIKDLSDENLISIKPNYPFIIKDFVKSEKGSDVFLFVDNIDTDEYLKKINRFIKMRGNSFNEGLVFKKYETLKKYSNNKLNEIRVFIFNKKIVSIRNNSSNELSKNINNDVVKIVNHIISKLDSNFYTVDLAEKDDGSLIVLETGSGEVSGLATSEKELFFWNKLISYWNEMD